MIKKKPLYWTEYQWVSYLQRVILVNSYLYYEKDNPKLSDREYDEICKMLVRHMKELPLEEVKEHTSHGYCMYDFDGNTGFDLWSRLTDQDKEKIMFIAKGAME